LHYLRPHLKNTTAHNKNINNENISVYLTAERIQLQRREMVDDTAYKYSYE